MSEAMTTTTELKRLAEAAFTAAVEVDMFQKGSKSQYDADNVRIMKLSEFHRAANPQAILSLIARLEKAEAALRPFVDDTEYISERDFWRDEELLSWHGPFGSLTIGDLRAARAVLETKP